MMPKMIVCAIGYVLFLAAATSFLVPLFLHLKIRGYM